MIFKKIQFLDKTNIFYSAIVRKLLPCMPKCKGIKSNLYLNQRFVLYHERQLIFTVRWPKDHMNLQPPGTNSSPKDKVWLHRLLSWSLNLDRPLGLITVWLIWFLKQGRGCPICDGSYSFLFHISSDGLR